MEVCRAGTKDGSGGRRSPTRGDSSPERGMTVLTISKEGNRPGMSAHFHPSSSTTVAKVSHQFPLPTLVACLQKGGSQEGEEPHFGELPGRRLTLW